MVQWNLYKELEALQLQEEAYDVMLPIESYFDTALYQAERQEDYDGCQLIIDTAKRFKIDLQYYDPE